MYTYCISYLSNLYISTSSYVSSYVWIIRNYNFNRIKPLLKYPLLNQETLVEREK